MKNWFEVSWVMDLFIWRKSKSFLSSFQTQRSLSCDKENISIHKNNLVNTVIALLN